MKNDSEKAVIGICPLCGSKLEKGFLVTNRPLRWDTRQHTWYARGELLTPLLDMVNLEAYRCTKCRLVVFRYEEHAGLWAESKE
jgi:hypothetical protein